MKAGSTLSVVRGALLTALVVGGCASGGSGAAHMNAVTVRVLNDRIPSTMLTIYAVPEGGIRILLGSVAAGDTATFDFTAFGGQYRFLARDLGGNELVSPPFTAMPPDIVDWRLQSNMVTPSRIGQ
jgi:hypothetical protein